MRRKAAGRAGQGAAKTGPRAPIDGTAPPTQLEPGSRLALSRLDWLATALIAIVLLVAPIWATSFPTPGRPTVFSKEAVMVQGAFGVALEIWAVPLILALTVGAFCLLAWREWNRPITIVAVPGLAPALGLLGIWAILSAAPNPALYLSLNALGVLLAGLLLGGMVSRLARDSRALVALVLAIVLAGSLVAAMGVREYLGALREGVVDHRTFSTFGPDFLAGYLLLTLPLTLAAFGSASQRWLRLSAGLGLALQSSCIFLTGSRAGTSIALAAVLGWALLAVLTCADRTRRRWVAAAVAIFVLSSVVSAAPILGRYGVRPPAPATAQTNLVKSTDAASTEDTQAHSGEFRKSTWIGAVRMATRHPILGTGIGTFALAYPKHADTSYTAHAHNSLLQWTAETGFPGAILVMVVFASAGAFCLHALLQYRVGRRDDPDLKDEPDREALLHAPGLLLCAIVASIAASTVHNMFDSDLYVVATLLTFCTVFGLAVAQARAVAPLAAEKPHAVGKELWAVGLAVCIFLAVRAGQTGLARWNRALVDGAESGVEAIDLARSAAASDPLDVEPRVALGHLLSDRPEGEVEYLAAARLAPGGMSYYLLGRYYRDQARAETDRLRKAAIVKSAIDAFERARAYDPHNLQVLKALAETLFEAGVEQNEPALVQQARFHFQTMANLEAAPYGRIRAVPEMVETDFAYAHDGLAKISVRDGKYGVAEKEIHEALRILRQYWERRRWLVNLNRRVEKRKAIADLYVQVLKNSIETAKLEGKSGEAPALEKELSRVEAEAHADEAKAGAPAG